MFRAAEVPRIIDNIAIVGREESGDALINTDNFRAERERFSLTFDLEADEPLVDLTLDQDGFMWPLTARCHRTLSSADTI